MVPSSLNTCLTPPGPGLQASKADGANATHTVATEHMAGPLPLFPHGTIQKYKVQTTERSRPWAHFPHLRKECG